MFDLVGSSEQKRYCMSNSRETKRVSCRRRRDTLCFSLDNTSEARREVSVCLSAATSSHGAMVWCHGAYLTLSLSEGLTCHTALTVFQPHETPESFLTVESGAFVVDLVCVA
jgi:hypothetical protein